VKSAFGQRNNIDSTAEELTEEAGQPANRHISRLAFDCHVDIGSFAEATGFHERAEHDNSLPGGERVATRREVLSVLRAAAVRDVASRPIPSAAELSLDFSLTQNQQQLTVNRQPLTLVYCVFSRFNDNGMRTLRRRLPFRSQNILVHQFREIRFGYRLAEK